MVDVSGRASIVCDADVTALHDDSTMSELTIEGGALTVEYAFDEPTEVKMLTVSAGRDPKAAPTTLTLQACADTEGTDWVTLDSRTALSYEFPNMIKPYAPPATAAYYRYRLSLSRADDTPMVVAEVELIGV
jgi:hypothetical protein